jgi:hypothetical protein
MLRLATDPTAGVPDLHPPAPDPGVLGRSAHRCRSGSPLSVDLGGRVRLNRGRRVRPAAAVLANRSDSGGRDGAGEGRKEGGGGRRRWWVARPCRPRGSDAGGET